MGWSSRYGKIAGPNPWKATGLEWTTASPPPVHNFDQTPVVIEPPYQYDAIEPDEIELPADRATSRII